uniref:Zasp-like motif domain-containing protein n=1 Tax=Photinus pyralis TaxID=7054 RepID=A0A1Y1KXV8_PHOPY
MILTRIHSNSFHPENEGAIMWPYRTTPLVLPGAKVKPDQTITECYLRHHPNPNVRARPHHLDADYYYKQKVVHKQFNSPIGLYSDPNIADTLQRQTGANVSRRNVKYDPSKSETYKALQEQSYSDRVHEVPVPPQTRIYTPIPGKVKTHNF